MWIGVDLGGTNLRIGVLNEESSLIYKEQIETRVERGPEAIVNDIHKMIEKAFDQYPKVQAVGIGVPGPLDSHLGIIKSPPHLTGWDNIPLKEKLEDVCPLPIHVENDAKVAALAEAWFGAGKGFDSVYYITVSTGLGGALILNREIFHGLNGYAGEIGNMIIKSDGYKHSTLNIGALETLVSGTALSRMAKEQLGIEGGAKELCRLALKENDKSAQDLLKTSISHLAMGIANIAHVVNPSLFILGGGVVMGGGDWFLNELKRQVVQYIFPEMNISIEKASLGGDAGIIGAALVGKTKYQK
ncbi:ROK family protein [Bacillaceae bacterium S4-13-58]